MRFWDTSAIVPLLIDEPNTALAAKLLRIDSTVVVWALTRTEAVSALSRKQRNGEIDATAFRRARARLEVLAQTWREISDVISVRGFAERFLTERALRAADALQLGAAWHHADGKPKRRELVVFDGPLVEVAKKVGFTALSPD